jgi:hypothetical protein
MSFLCQEPWHRTKADQLTRPWQNGVAERFIGNCRRDSLDPAIVPNDRQLKHLMVEYIRYYQDDLRELLRLPPGWLADFSNEQPVNRNEELSILPEQK